MSTKYSFLDKNNMTFVLRNTQEQSLTTPDLKMMESVSITSCIEEKLMGLHSFLLRTANGN